MRLIAVGDNVTASYVEQGVYYPGGQAVASSATTLVPTTFVPRLPRRAYRSCAAARHMPQRLHPGYASWMVTACSCVARAIPSRISSS